MMMAGRRGSVSGASGRPRDSQYPLHFEWRSRTKARKTREIPEILYNHQQRKDSPSGALFNGGITFLTKCVARVVYMGHKAKGILLRLVDVVEDSFPHRFRFGLVRLEAASCQKSSSGNIKPTNQEAEAQKRCR